MKRIILLLIFILSIGNVNAEIFINGESQSLASHLPAPGTLADGQFNSIQDIILTAGYGNTAFADLVYLNNDDSKIEKTQADAATSAADVLVGIVTEIVAEDATCVVMLEGTMTHDAWNWGTVGASLWISDTTAGEFLATKPDTTDDIIRPVAYVIDDDTIYFHGGTAYATKE